MACIAGGYVPVGDRHELVLVRRLPSRSICSDVESVEGSFTRILAHQVFSWQDFEATAGALGWEDAGLEGVASRLATSYGLERRDAWETHDGGDMIWRCEGEWWEDARSGFGGDESAAARGPADAVYATAAMS
jgi:hypothetical protein